MTRKQAVEELERLARDPNRQRLKEKFRQNPAHCRNYWARACSFEEASGLATARTCCLFPPAAYTRADCHRTGVISSPSPSAPLAVFWQCSAE